MLKPYEVKTDRGVSLTLLLDDDHAKRLGVFGKDIKSAESLSNASEASSNTEAPKPENKELTAAKIKADNAAKRKAARDAASANKDEE